MINKQQLYRKPGERAGQEEPRLEGESYWHGGE